jgi:penicillin amidase
MIPALLKRLLIISGMLLVVLALATVWLIVRPWPKTAGILHVKGLQERVEILRDTHGVPDIYASNEHDLFFAQGYVHAQDRLFQMEFQRRVGMGRLSEIFGAATLDVDKFLRTIGTNRGARVDSAMAESAMRARLQAYCDGVNAFVERHRHRLPVEFLITGCTPEPWTITHIFAWVKMMRWSLESSFGDDIVRQALFEKLGQERFAALFGWYPADAPLIVPDSTGAQHTDLPVLDRSIRYGGLFLSTLGMGLGSNNWVVGPSRTASRSPLLANDPHLAFGTPAVWYLIGLHAPGFDVKGASLPGIPFVVSGHNARIGWGVTALLADMQDCYAERPDPADPSRYEVNGALVRYDTVTELIGIKGRRESLRLRVRMSRHGPLINDVVKGLSRPVAFKWMASVASNGSAKAMYLLDKAASWADVQAALRNWDGPPQNFVYADVDGNIGYWGAGKVPVRKCVIGDRILPGWNDSAEWIDTVSFDSLPHCFNPAEALIVTANQKPVGDPRALRLSTAWSAPFRAERIRSHLEGRTGLTLDDMRAAQADTISLLARVLAPIAVAVPATDSAVRRAQDTVRAWNGRLDGASAASGILEVLWPQVLRDALIDDLGDSLTNKYLSVFLNSGDMQSTFLCRILADSLNAWWDDATTPGRETRTDIVERALRRTVQWWSWRAGPDISRWTWGSIHRLNFGHVAFGKVPALNRFFGVDAGPFSGNGLTPFAGFYNLDDPFAVIAGPVFRETLDIGNWDSCRIIVTPGQSGCVGHRHYADLWRSWRSVDYIPMLWTRTAIEAKAEGRLALIPDR